MVTGVKRFIGVAAVAAVIFAASQADARWGRGGSSGGSWGSWGSSGGSSGGSWGSSGGSWGSSGGSSGGSWGSSGGSSGGHYYGSWGSSGGSSGGYYGHSHHPHHHHHAAPAAPGDMPGPPADNRSNRPSYDGTTPPPAPTDGATPPAPGAPADGSSTQYNTGSALLSVNVPSDAKVFVNGVATTSRGSQREFISRRLQNGSRYNYEIRAEITRDGKTLSQIKSTQLGAGENGDLAFDFSQEVQQASADGAKTTLVVNVPADAKVYLADRETRLTGAVRQFTTTKLAAGQEWISYPVRAAVLRDGKMIERQEIVTLKAGDSQVVNFDFGSDAVGKVANAAR